MARRFLLPLLLTAIASGGRAGDDDALGRILARMAQTIAKTPNYTCTETIERRTTGVACPECEVMHRFRLDVAVIERKERYAWPGAARFEDRGISEMLGHGESVSGNFAGLAAGVFRQEPSMYAFEGEAKLGGRKALRYSYRVPAGSSGFLVRLGPDEGIVPFDGSFWVDPASLDLMRLEARVAAAPGMREFHKAVSVIDYRRSRIGASEFLLPSGAETVIEYRDGRKSRNQWTFTGCHQYVGESTIRFGDAPGGGEPARVDPVAKANADGTPPGLQLTARLNTPITMSGAAAGDPIALVVTRAVARIPKGALLRGRISKVERIRAGRRSATTVAFEFKEIEFENRRVPFRGGLRDCTGFLPRPGIARFGMAGTASVLVFNGSPQSIPAGLQLHWETQ